LSRAHDNVVGACRPEPSYPLRTIQDIRKSLPEDQENFFDAELAVTDLDELPQMLTRWATSANDGFEELLLSTPFDGLKFGARSYDEPQTSE
jgi:hypothetical protein